MSLGPHAPRFDCELSAWPAYRDRIRRRERRSRWVTAPAASCCYEWDAPNRPHEFAKWPGMAYMSGIDLVTNDVSALRRFRTLLFNFEQHGDGFRPGAGI